MPDFIMPFDDPDFDAALARVMDDPGLPPELLDQAAASDHLWAAAHQIAAGLPTLQRELGDEAALMATILVAFTQGYRTGRIQQD